MRHLIYHPESDCYLEIFDESEFIALMESSEGGMLCEVTGFEEHEIKFNQYKPNQPNEVTAYAIQRPDSLQTP